MSEIDYNAAANVIRSSRGVPAWLIAERAVDAALANGQRVEWCETCNDKARPPCWNSVGTPIEGHGLIHSIVSKILIGPPTEEV